MYSWGICCLISLVVLFYNGEFNDNDNKNNRNVSIGKEQNISEGPINVN